MTIIHPDDRPPFRVFGTPTGNIVFIEITLGAPNDLLNFRS